GAQLLAHELAHVVQQGSAPRAPIRRQTSGAPGPPSAKATDDLEGPPTPEPLDQPRLPAPNKAPAYDEICGEPEKCIQGPGEHCSDDATMAASAAWKRAAKNVTNAVDEMTNNPDGETVRQSLKANFNWSKVNDQ